MKNYHELRRPILDFLEALPSQAQVQVVDFDSFLCAENSCLTTLDGVFVYGKGNHLSIEGSRILAKQMHLVDKIREKAR